MDMNASWWAKIHDYPLPGMIRKAEADGASRATRAYRSFTDAEITF
jgi:hypothetical protein